MAEALGVASGVISMVGFVGQLAQGSAFLHRFFKDLRDAPQAIGRISEELLILTALLKEVQSAYANEAPDVARELEFCAKTIHELTEVVRKLELPPNTAKATRRWKQFRAALTEPEISKHLGKTTLFHSASLVDKTVLTINRRSQSEQLSLLQRIEPSISEILQKQEALEPPISDIRTALASLEAKASTLNATCSDISTTTLHMNAIMATMASETQHIRVESNRSESVTLDLLNTAMNRQTELFADLRNDLHGTISRNIRKEVRQAFPDLSDARSSSSRKTSHAVRTLERESRTESNTSDLQRPARHSRLESEWTSQWRKVSSTSTRRTFSRISLFGKIIITTTTTTYSGNVSLDGRKSQKEVSHTTVVYVPAFWMFGTGVILKYITGKLMGEISQPKPAFSMRTINIIPEKSAILTACMGLDLTAIRSLFDLGRASPFDVSEHGRNLLHYTIMGMHSTIMGILWNIIKYRGASRAVARESLKRMFTMVDWFLDAGVDGGMLDDCDQSTIGLLHCDHTFSPNIELIEAFSDEFQFLMHKVLRHTEQDPFCTCSALIVVTHGGKYVAESFPGSPPGWWGPLAVHPAILQATLSQSDWLLSWDERQLQDLCNILPCYEVCLPKFQGSAKMRLKFLVTSHAKGLQSHLDAKSKLLRLLLHRDVFSTTAELGRSLYIDAVHVTIHSGGYAFSVLTEHDYDGKERPWIRQKFQKLLLIRAFMLDTLTIILDALWSVSPKKDDTHWKAFAQHAQSYNSRTHDVYMTALRNTKYQTSDTGFAIDSDPGGNDDRPNHQHIGDDEGWETEHSSTEEDGWETEEEWQEGYMLDKAVDRDHLDDRNMQMKRRGACQDSKDDFDASYWEQFLPRTQEPSEVVADHGQGNGTISKVFNAAKRVAGF